MTSADSFTLAALHKRLQSLLALAVTTFLICLSLVANADEVKPTYFLDCGYMDFAEGNDKLLTREERIAKMEGRVLKALDDAQHCMREASAQGNQRLADAGQGTGEGQGEGGSAAGGESQQGASQQQTNAENTQNRQTQQTTSSTASTTSKPHIQGKRGGGRSSVCDAIEAGLAAAENDTEKAHFEELLQEYGCK